MEAPMRLHAFLDFFFLLDVPLLEIQVMYQSSYKPLAGYQNRMSR